MTWLQTHSGKVFDYLKPTTDSVLIEDIAHALSKINRFGGHTVHPYSVAQHNVLMSTQVPSEYAMEALLHDAHEAYVGDVISPLKSLMPAYKEIELRISALVRKKKI